MSFLKWEDYVVFVVTLIFSLAIGLFYSIRGKQQQTTKQFILGDGNMAVLPVALSLMVTFESGIMMLGVPAEVYMYGIQWYMSAIAYFLARLVAVFLIIPSQWKLNITSIYQYFELRYKSKGLRLFATVLNLFSTAHYLGSVVFVPAITLEIVADIPMEISIITLMGIVLIYTIVGGFTAVIWTDVFQAVLMFGGLFAILIKGVVEAGGITNTWSRIIEKGRFNLFDFDPDPTLRQSFWSLFIGSLLSGLRIQFTQASFQRIKATPSVSAAQRMYFIATVVFAVITALAVMAGGVMFAYYDTIGCDPLVAKQVRNPNQLMAKLVRDIFYDTPCLPGLFLAALFSASLSTMSSLLSAMSAVFWEDIVKPHTKPMSNKKALCITRFSVFLFGGLGIIFAFVILRMKGPILQIMETTGACMSGAMHGIMMLGWFVPTANSLGAMIGGIVSFLFVGWISIGKMTSSGTRVNLKLDPASTENCLMFNESGLMTEYGQNVSYTVWNSTIFTTQASPIALEPQGVDILYSLSYKWLLPLGLTLVLVVGSITSRFQAQQPVDPGLTVPFCDALCCCVPEYIRRKFQCGVKYSGEDEDKDMPESRDILLHPPEYCPSSTPDDRIAC